MTGLPTVSVAMINHNYGQYLAQAVESALDQGLPPLEVVVVDDGSTDSSPEVLQGYGEHIRAICTPNRGRGAATNTAVAACRGDVVALIDSDDLMLPGRLRRLAETYSAFPQAQWVWHDLQHVQRDTLEPLPSVEQRGFTRGLHDHRAAVARGRLPITAPATSALSWRRPFLDSLLPMAPAMRSQDNYLKFVSLGLAPGCVLDEPLALQGIHGSNAYTTATGADRRLKQAQHAIDLAPGLHRHGLYALERRLVAEALVTTRGTLLLDSADRSALLRQLPIAGLRTVPWLGAAAARQGRALLQSRPRRSAAAV